ncbi:hypothetical protein BGW38_000198, partial [Lunasporangiospora selenospora]
MRLYPLIAVISLISLAFADECDVVNTEDEKWTNVRKNVLPLLGIALSFPAGFGPLQALGISVFSFFLDKIIPDPSQNPDRPDPLKLLAIELSNRMDEKLDTLTIDFFNQYAGSARNFFGNYKQAYDSWVKDERPANEKQSYSLYKFYVGQMGFLEDGPIKMSSSKFAYLALPQFVSMATIHLSVLRDAAMIGNDHLGITNTTGSKTNFREQFKKYLQKYNDALVRNYYAPFGQLSKKQHGDRYLVFNDDDFRMTKRSQELFSAITAYETTAILSAFDVAARWPMLLPPEETTLIDEMDKNNIPIDVVYTRPIYSESTKCNSYDDGFDRNNVPNSYCNINILRLKTFQQLGIPYRGLLKTIRYAKWRKDTKGPLGFTRFWFTYEDGSIVRTPGDIDNDQVGYEDMAYEDSKFITITVDPKSSVNITYAKINPDFSCGSGSCSIFAGLHFGTTSMAITPKCTETNEKLDIPEGHRFAGLYPVQNNRPREHFKWEIAFSMEYRKINRIDFQGVTTPRALRFPADYIKFQEKITGTTEDEMVYLLGGRAMKFPSNIGFRLPVRNKGFDYNLRLYAKSTSATITVNGCVLGRRGVKFGGYDLYEGDCQQQEVVLPERITIPGPLSLAGVEVTQVKVKIPQTKIHQVKIPQTKIHQ